jgi:hypothetical protein
MIHNNDHVDARSRRAYYVPPMDNRPAWVRRVEAALARGESAYRKAAEIILAQLKADPALTQAKVAEHIGHRPAWVSRLLTWYEEGCPPDGVFAGEAAFRRARAKAEVSSSKSPGLDLGPDRPFFPGIEGGPTNAPPFQEAEATRLALTAEAACQDFDKAIGPISVEKMTLVYRSEGDVVRRGTLKKVEAGLQRSIKAAGAALRETQAALKKVAELPKAAE